MALDGRALLQQRQERALFNASIAATDTWIQARIRRILAGVPEPDPGMDSAGLEAYASELEDYVSAEVEAMTRDTKKLLKNARRRAIVLGLDATERLVEAQLPSAEEVRSGHPDADRTA